MTFDLSYHKSLWENWNVLKWKTKVVHDMKCMNIVCIFILNVIMNIIIIIDNYLIIELVNVQLHCFLLALAS